MTDNVAVLRHRLEVLRKIRDPEQGVRNLAICKAHYRLNPWDFVRDWGITYDPRLISADDPLSTPYVPFIPWPRQVELMKWLFDHWRRGQDGLVPKSRDTGASWVAMSFSAALCIFWPGMAIGFGSRKEEYVDKLDSPKSLFFKGRLFIEKLPVEFRAGWTREKHGAFMRLTFPETGSVITGEAGDNIGRGDRTALYIVDESAHLERPQLAEASLSATTNCRIDMSSVNGMDNPFAEKAHSWPPEDIFIMHWRDDPRRDDAWYEKLKEKKDAVVIAQEYDINYAASVAGVVIPQEWIQAAVDAHIKLGIKVGGERTAGLDVADEGPDLNAIAGRYGILLEYCESFSGKGSDLFQTTEHAHDVCASERYTRYRYDADGLGAGVRGDARKINEERGTDLTATPFRGSAAVFDPDGKIEEIDGDSDKDKEQRTNADYFANAKAQGWWALRMRFQRTFRAVTLGHVYDPDSLISISSHIPDRVKLCLELSQPTYSKNGAGKMLINKAPDGMKSPNMGDSVMIVFAGMEPEKRGFFDL